MQPESSGQSRAKGAESDTTQCPSCRAVLPLGMRFCRACGYRLGEGLDEYVETVRLKPRAQQAERPSATTASTSPKPDPFQPQGWGPITPQHATSPNLQSGAYATFKGSKQGMKGVRKTNWMLWIIISVILFSVAGGGLLTPFALRGGFKGPSASSSASKSYFGVNGFRSADGGAFIDYAYPPGGPADKAGLVGGDVVVSFDGKPVKSDGDIRNLLAATPIGKTVDVVFLRDGQTRTTKLTTISKAELDRMDGAFDRREDKGYLKEGTDIDRVIVPGMNIYGVRLNRIGKSGPADMAGLKDGDIVIEFDGIPTRTRRELEVRIERAQPYSTVTVVVIREGQRVEVPVKVGLEP